MALRKMDDLARSAKKRTSAPSAKPGEAKAQAAKEIAIQERNEQTAENRARAAERAQRADVKKAQAVKLELLEQPQRQMPFSVQINRAYADMVNAQRQSREAIVHAENSQKRARSLNPQNDPYFRSLRQKIAGMKNEAAYHERELNRLSTAFESAPTQANADAYNAYVNEVKRWNSQGQKTAEEYSRIAKNYQDAVADYNNTCQQATGWAQKAGEMENAYQRMVLQAAQGRSDLWKQAKPEVRKDIQNQSEQQEAAVKKYYEQQIAAIDRELEKLNQNPAGYLGQTGGNVLDSAIDRANALKAQKSDLNNTLYNLERYGTAAKMEREAGDDPDFEQYAESGKKTVEENRRTVLLGGGDASWFREYDAMTDDQKAVYGYYVGKYGDQAAQAYKAQLQLDLHAKMSEDYLKRVQQGAEQDPVGYGLASIITAPFATARTAADMIAGGAESLTAPKSKYPHYADPNTPGQVMTRGNQLAREIGLNKIENPVLRTLGKVGYSMADMAPSIALSAAGFPTLGAAYMGAQEGTGNYTDVTARGVPQGQALAYGVTSGIVSSLLEKIGIDNIGKAFAGGKHTATQILRGMLGSFVAEGSEEAVENRAQVLYDHIINGTKSSRNIAKQQYRNDGLSPEEAERRSWEDIDAETWESFLVGGLAGGLMSGGGYLGSAGLSKTARSRTENQLELVNGNSNVENTWQKAPQYSIAKTPNGQKYVEVDTDQHRFDGLSLSEMQKEARDVILEKFRNKVIGTDNQAYVNRKTAEEYSHPAKVLRNSEIKEAKMRASTELDNILTVSKFIEHQNDDGRHTDAVGGWDKYETTFKVGNRYYRGEISIKNTAKGRLLYDVTQIKDITGSPPLTIGKTNMAASTDDVFNKSIPSSSENVNAQAENTWQKAPKYSIQEAADGEKITVLDTRQDIFEGKPQKDYAKIARNEILDHFKGQILPLGENDLARVTGKTAREYAYPHNQPEGILDTAKMKASTELDNLLKTAEYVYSAEDTKNHKEATLGFDYYKTKFVVDGHVFEGLLNIATSDKGRVLYDVTKIREVSDTSGKYATLMAQSTSAFGNLSDNSIPNSPENVNAQAENTWQKAPKYSFLGYDLDTGKGMYEGNFPAGTPKKAKSKEILSLVQNVWSKEPITLFITENGESKQIKARYDPTYDPTENVPTDASKIAGGNRHGTAKDQRVTLDLGPDYPKITADAVYNYSKAETGKSNPTHRNVKEWHYFINDILFAEKGSNEFTPYRVSINVKDNTDGTFIYSYSAENQKRQSAPQTLHAAVNSEKSLTANTQPFKNSIPNSSENVNAQEESTWQKAPQYSLTPYSDHQKENWANSKNILVYENQEQFNKFLSEAVQTKGATGKKMYFGMVEGDLANRIKAETGIDVTGYNLTLAASEVQKILNDHGNPNTEVPRGQRAITVEDFQDIPRIIQEADSIEKGSRKYEGHDVLKFQKKINGKTTVVTYQIGSNHDLRVQTMYSGQSKRSLATAPGGTMSFPHTSETLSGTASFTNNIPNSSENVNAQAENTWQKAPKYSIQEAADGEKITVLDTRQDIFEGKPQKDYAKIARNEILDHFKGQILPLGENDLARVTGKTAREYAHPHTELADRHYQAKMKASTELDNLLKTAEYVYSAEDTKNHKEATLGFDYYKTKFVVDGHAFEGLLNIATSDNGRVLYDVTKIKEVPLSDTRATRMAQSASTSLGDFYAPSIPNSSENVNAQEENAWQKAPQYSLNEFEDGKRFVDVQTDQTMFEGLSESEKARLATKIIKERFAGKVIGVDNPVFVNGRTAAEFGHPAKNLEGEIRAAKAQASTELDNLIDAGANFRTAADGADGHIHPRVTGGFSYFDTIFKVGNDYYKGVINIQNTAKGKLLKDITKIENITQDISSSYGNNPKSTFLRDTSIPSIPNSSENVNYPAPFGMDPIEWGRRKRNAAGAKTSLEETAALYNVDPETYAAAEKLAKETGARIVFDGTLGAGVNGYYQNGEIHVNPAAKDFTVVFSHELTHHLESTDAYRKLLSFVSDRLGDESAQQAAIEKKIAEYYRGSKGRVKLSKADARTELVAEYISENLFTNETEILRFAKANMSLAQQVKNFISRLAAKVTGNTEKQFLLNAERLYQKAIGEAKKTTVEQENGARKEMLNGAFFTEDKYFARQIDQWMDMADGQRIKVGDVRQGSALNKVGLPSSSMYFDVGKIKKAMAAHGDHLTTEILKGIPDLLNDPIVITEYTGSDGTVKNTVNVYGNLFANGKPVVVGVVMHLDRSGRNIISNIRTIHARSDFEKQITDRSVLYLNEDKRKTRSWFQVCGNLNVPLEGTKYGLIRSIAFENENSNRKFLLNPGFASELDAWDEKSDKTFQVGTTSDVLKSIGVNDRNIIWHSRKIGAILSKHNGMTLDIVKQVPQILENPVAVLKSKQSDTRLLMFGELEDANGAPVTAVLELQPVNKGGELLNLNVIASAYGKDSNAARFIESSDLLYLDPDRNRTGRWLQGLGLQLPSDITTLGSIGTVTYQDGNVKIEGVPYQQYMQNQSGKDNAGFSISPDQQSTVDKAVQMLDNGSTPNEVYSQTGLVVMANGDIYNGIGGEKVGAWNNGTAQDDKGRFDNSGSTASTRNNGRKDRGDLAGNSTVVRGTGWADLSTDERERVVSAVASHMEQPSNEGQALLNIIYSGDVEAFTEQFYSMLQQGHPVAEQWANFIPDIQGLMDEIETAVDETGRKYSLSPEETSAPDPEYQQLVEKHGAIPEGEKPRDRKISQVRINTFENAPTIFEKADLAAREMEKSGFAYDVKTEQASMKEARARLEEDYEGTAAALPEMDAWGSSDLDAAMEILRRKNVEARESGDYSAAAEWAKLIQEKGTSAGQMIQAFAKYSRTPEGVLTTAARNLQRLVDSGVIDMDTMNSTLRDMAQFTETLDAIEEGDNKSLVDLIVKQAERRNTKVSGHILKKLNAEPDFKYLYDFALTQMENIAADLEKVSAGRKLSTFQTMSHLLNLRTGMRNVVSNQVFDIVDAVANDVSMIPDAILGAFTGRRTVGFQKSWLSKAKRQGAAEGYRRGALEISLDVQPRSSDGKSKYGTGGRRTWKANDAGWLGRRLSAMEKVMGYELNVTDEFHKGSVMAETLESLEKLVDKGYLTRAEAAKMAAQEALYRSFQDDTLPGAILAGLKNTLNHVGIGGGKIKEFGLGDIVQKYTQVPGALISRAVEFSPAGYVKAVAALAGSARKKGSLAAYRAKAATSSQAAGVQASGHTSETAHAYKATASENSIPASGGEVTQVVDLGKQKAGYVTQAPNANAPGTTSETLLASPYPNSSIPASGRKVNQAANAGRVTRIQKPYQGEVPQNVSSSKAQVEILAKDIQLASQKVLEARKTPQFKATLKRTMQEVFNNAGGQRLVTAENVAFKGSPYEIQLNPNLVGKVISDPNISVEKVAALYQIDRIVESSEYVGSGEYNKVHEKKSQVVRYDYFENQVEIGGNPYIVAFDVEVYKDRNNFRTYKVINEIDLTPMDAIHGSSTRSGVQKESSLSKDSIPASGRKVNRISAEAQRKAALAIGRATTGTGLITAFAALAACGLLRRADDEDDKNVAALNSAEGIGGTQINISGIGRWLSGESTEWQAGDVVFDLDFMEPLNALMTLGAMIAQDDSEKGFAGKLMDNTLESLFAAIRETPTMQTLDSIHNTIQYHDEETDLPVWLEIPVTIAESGITGFVPSVVRQIAQATDTNYRDQYSTRNQIQQIGDKIKNTIPGLRQTLPEKLDNFGEEKTYFNPWLNAFNAAMFPGNINVYRQSEVSKELESVRERTGRTDIYPTRNAPYTVKFGDESLDLTPEERRTYQKTRGSLTNTLMSDLLQSEGYREAGAARKADLLAAAVDFANDLAKRELTQDRGVVYTTKTWDKTLEAMESGISFGDYQSWKLETAGMKSGEKRDVLQKAGLPDNVKRALYELDVSGDHGEKIDAVLEAGLEFNDFLEVQGTYSLYSANKEMKAGEKAREFSYWVDKQDFTAEQKEAVKDKFTFFSMVPAEAGQYDKFVSAGVGADTAYEASALLSELEPEEGRERVSDYQKALAVVQSDYSPEKQEKLLSAVLEERQYEKLHQAEEQGIGAQIYLEFAADTSAMEADKDENGKSISGSKKSKVMTYIDGLDLTDGQKDQLYFAAGYKESTIDDAPWHGGEKYEGGSYSGRSGSSRTSSGGSSRSSRNTGTAPSAAKGKVELISGRVTGKTGMLPKFSGLSNSRSVKTFRYAKPLTLPTAPKITRSAVKGKYAKKIISPYNSGMLASRALATTPDGKLKKL